MPVVEKTDRHGRQIMDINSVLFAEKRIIFIDDIITDALASETTKQLLYLASAGNDDITLVINSPGGSVTAGLAIYDAMTGIPCDVSTVCIGMAASMGAFLLAAGTPGKRFATPNSEVMIHQVMGGASGQAVDVQIAAQRIGRTKDRINNMLSVFTHQPLAKIQVDTDRDYYLSAAEAVEYGLVDSVKSSIL